MQWHRATETDIPRPGSMNASLIEDARHQNPVYMCQLETRLHDWLAGQYSAILFEEDGVPVAHGLFRPADQGRDGEGIYLRQCFAEGTGDGRG